MAESNVNIMLDTVRRNRINIIYAVENDYGARFITATIMTDGKKKAIERAAVVTINAERPDGQRKAFEGSVNEDGTVRVPVTQWMLEFEGEVVCSVSIVTSTSRLTTTHFYIQAQYSVWDGTSAPSSDDPNKDVIVSIIAAENERVANENARISAENARKTAETARIDAENIRIAKESVRVSNEAERVSAESVRKTEFATWQGEVGKISSFDKRIENLEAAVNPGLVTPTVDDSAAYSKDVPTGALPYASVSEVGGMTYNVNGVLRDAKVTAVESVGANLFNIDDLTWVGTKVNDITLSTRGILTAFANIKVIPNKQYTVSGYAYGVDNSSGLQFAVLDGKDKTYPDSLISVVAGVTVAKKYFSLKFTAQSEWVCLTTLATTVELCRVNVGNTDLGWTPYAKNTFEIPEAIQNLDGYGLGINKGCHNKIVLNPADGVKKFVKQNGEIDLGTLEWGISYDYFISAYVPNRKPGLFNIIVEGGAIAPTYNGSFDDSFPHGTWGGVANYSTITYKMHPNEYADAIAFKNAMKGKRLIYELATPVETDISVYFGDDNLIGVEAGGTLTMVNEYGYDVPSVIEYTVKGSDAT